MINKACQQSLISGESRSRSYVAWTFSQDTVIDFKIPLIEFKGTRLRWMLLFLPSDVDFGIFCMKMLPLQIHCPQNVCPYSDASLSFIFSLGLFLQPKIGLYQNWERSEKNSVSRERMVCGRWVWTFRDNHRVLFGAGTCWVVKTAQSLRSYTRLSLVRPPNPAIEAQTYFS